MKHKKTGMRIYSNQIKIWFDAPAKRWTDGMEKRKFDKNHRKKYNAKNPDELQPRSGFKKDDSGSSSSVQR